MAKVMNTTPEMRLICLLVILIDRKCPDQIESSIQVINPKLVPSRTPLKSYTAPMTTPVICDLSPHSARIRLVTKDQVVSKTGSSLRIRGVFALERLSFD